MPAYCRPYSRLDLLLGTFSEWLKQRRELKELHELDRTDFDRIANDLRVSPGDLDELVRHGPHSADEMPKMLKALGIDEAALASIEPLVVRDMERVCGLCTHKRQCHRDLVAGTAADHYTEYCLNAATINEIRRSVER